jgi:predicted nuclease with TOPRIM domain
MKLPPTNAIPSAQIPGTSSPASSDVKVLPNTPTQKEAMNASQAKPEVVETPISATAVIAVSKPVLVETDAVKQTPTAMPQPEIATLQSLPATAPVSAPVPVPTPVLPVALPTVASIPIEAVKEQEAPIPAAVIPASQVNIPQTTSADMQGTAAQVPVEAQRQVSETSAQQSAASDMNGGSQDHRPVSLDTPQLQISAQAPIRANSISIPHQRQPSLQALPVHLLDLARPTPIAECSDSDSETMSVVPLDTSKSDTPEQLLALRAPSIRSVEPLSDEPSFTAPSNNEETQELSKPVTHVHTAPEPSQPAERPSAHPPAKMHGKKGSGVLELGVDTSFVTLHRTTPATSSERGAAFAAAGSSSAANLVHEPALSPVTAGSAEEANLTPAQQVERQLPQGSYKRLPSFKHVASMSSSVPVTSYIAAGLAGFDVQSTDAGDAMGSAAPLQRDLSRREASQTQLGMISESHRWEQYLVALQDAAGELHAHSTGLLTPTQSEAPIQPQVLDRPDLARFPQEIYIARITSMLSSIAGPRQSAVLSSSASSFSPLLQQVAGATMLGLPICQVLHSFARSVVMSKRQDLAQLKQQLGSALKEVAAVEFDLAGSRGRVFGDANGDRGRVVEDVALESVKHFQQQAAALRSSLESREAADVAVGIPALSDHLQRHDPMLNKLAKERIEQEQQALQGMLESISAEAVTLHRLLEERRSEESKEQAACQDLSSQLVKLRDAAEELKAKQETEISHLISALARAEGLELVADASGPGCISRETLVNEPFDDSPEACQRRLNVLIANAEKEARAEASAVWSLRLQKVQQEAQTRIHQAIGEGEQALASVDGSLLSLDNVTMRNAAAKKVNSRICDVDAKTTRVRNNIEACSAAIGGKEAEVKRFRATVAGAAGLQNLKKSTRLLWRLRSIPSASITTFLQDALAFAPYSEELVTKLKSTPVRSPQPSSTSDGFESEDAARRLGGDVMKRLVEQPGAVGQARYAGIYQHILAADQVRPPVLVVVDPKVPPRPPPRATLPSAPPPAAVLPAPSEEDEEITTRTRRADDQHTHGREERLSIVPEDDSEEEMGGEEKEWEAVHDPAKELSEHALAGLAPAVGIIRFPLPEMALPQTGAHTFSVRLTAKAQARDHSPSSQYRFMEIPERRPRDGNTDMHLLPLAAPIASVSGAGLMSVATAAVAYDQYMSSSGTGDTTTQATHLALGSTYRVSAVPSAQRVQQIGVMPPSSRHPMPTALDVPGPIPSVLLTSPQRRSMHIHPTPPPKTSGQDWGMSASLTTQSKLSDRFDLDPRATTPSLAALRPSTEAAIVVNTPKTALVTFSVPTPKIESKTVSAATPVLLQRSVRHH